MNIGAASKASGVSAKMIRHYESIGLIAKADRTQAGYRNYRATDVHVLSFIRQARSAGFGIAQIEQLLSLWGDRGRSAREVKRLADRHLDDVKRKIDEFQAIARTLEHLVAHCAGDDRPECPILDAFARGTQMPAANSVRSRPRARRRP